jgi:hypothetical protein
MLRKREKSLAPDGNRTPIPLSCSSLSSRYTTEFSVYEAKASNMDIALGDVRAVVMTDPVGQGHGNVLPFFQSDVCLSAA